MNDAALYTVTPEGVATLALNRPEARNALNTALCEALLAAARRAEAEAARLLLLRANGPVFCAGADLKERKGMGDDAVRARRLKAFAAYDAIERLPMPVVAVVEGPAVGSGCEIAAACDFVVATPAASFRTPEALWGTVGATQRLPRVLGKRLAKDLMFTGRALSAEEARAAGLVARVVAPEALEAVLEEIAATVAKAPSAALALAKRCIDEGLERDPRGALATELMAIEESLAAAEWRRTMAGFGERRRDERAPDGALRTPMDLSHICPLTTDAALRRAAVIAPEVEAVVAPGGRITFAALEREVAAIRGALAAAGVRRGDHVGICLGNGPRWVALFLALGSLGAVTVPVNTRFRGEEMAYALRQSRVRLLFLAARFLKVDFVAMLRGICPAVDAALPDPALPDLARVVVLGGEVPPKGARSWEEFLAAGAAGGTPAEACCAPDDTLLIQYTSGTTAFPKGVMLSHRSMCADAFFSGGRMGLRAADRFHSARPFFHVAGSTLSVLACIQHAATLVTMDRFEPGEALRIMEEERCTHFSGNDTMALMLLNHPDRPRRRLALRGAWAAASPAIVRRIVEELGARECVVGYGLSEASPNVAQSAWWEPEEVRIGGRMLPQPGVAVRIRDLETGRDCGPGGTGEILVRGWSVMRGYFDKPAETAAALDAEGWLSTGDLGRLDATGRLEFVGRARDLIRVGGENVAPAEIEDILHRHPKIRQAVVVGVPDPRLVEVPCAFVVLNEGQSCTPEELLDWSRARMAGFKVPRHVRVVEGFEEIGMTASSKIRRRQLADRAARLLGLRDGT